MSLVHEFRNSIVAWLCSLARGSGLLLLAAALAGCSGGWPLGSARAPSSATVTAQPPIPQDPLLAFAAQAAPGATGQVVLAETGRPTPVRLVRSYHAASGRPCRELAVGVGSQERARLVCLDKQGWVEARPLLRGGGVARP